MPYDTLLRSILLYYAIPSALKGSQTILYHAILYSASLYSTLLCHTLCSERVPNYTIPCHTILCFALLYDAIPSALKGSRARALGAPVPKPRVPEPWALNTDTRKPEASIAAYQDHAFGFPILDSIASHAAKPYPKS